MFDLEAIFKELVWDTLIRFVIASIFKALPLLGWGPVGAIVTVIITSIGDKIFLAFKQFINLNLIVIKNTQWHSAWADAQIGLKAVALSNGIDSEEFNNARALHRARFNKLVSFN